MNRILLSAIGTLIMALGAAAIQARTPGAPTSPAQTGPREPAPSVQQLLQDEIAAIPAETLEQSLDRLGRVGPYYHPAARGRGGGGGGVMIPLSAADEQAAYTLLFTNPRVGKVLAELAAKPRDEAAKLVSTQLSQSLKTYKELYQTQVARLAEIRKANPSPRGGPGIGYSMNDDPAGTPSLVGMRLKILALLVLAGNLELKDSALAVAEIAQAALEQRKQLYADAGALNQSDRFSLLRLMSLYHRSALLTAAAGTMPPPAAQAEALKKRTVQRLGQRDLWYVTPTDGAGSDAVIDANFAAATNTK